MPRQQLCHQPQDQVCYGSVQCSGHMAPSRSRSQGCLPLTPSTSTADQGLQTGCNYSCELHVCKSVLTDCLRRGQAPKRSASGNDLLHGKPEECCKCRVLRAAVPNSHPGRSQLGPTGSLTAVQGQLHGPSPLGLCSTRCALRAVQPQCASSSRPVP